MRRDDVELEPKRSITHLMMPIGLVAVVLAQAVYVAMRVGSREEKLDTVVETVKDIKSEMYRRTDAEKDAKVVDLRLANLEHRVDVLEQARQRHVDVVQARVERQDDDMFTRIHRFLVGTDKPR